MTTGQRIRAARKKAGLTQEELARKLDISYQSVGQWEREERNPKIENLVEIATALGIDWLDLIPEKKPEQEPDREYEELRDALASAHLQIEESGRSAGPDESGDYFFVWHDDAEDVEEDRVERTFADLQRIVSEAQKAADWQRAVYLAQRLEVDIFWPKGIRPPDAPPHPQNAQEVEDDKSPT